MFEHRRKGPIMTVIYWFDNLCLGLVDWFKGLGKEKE